MVSTVESTIPTTVNVTGHAACRAVLRDDGRFPAGPGLDSEAARLRRHCAYQALSPGRRCAALEPEMRRHAASMVAALRPGRADLVRQLAAPYAAAVLGDYFGLPQPAWHDFYEQWLEGMRPPDDPRGDRLAALMRPLRFRQARADFMAAVSTALADRRREPRNDVLTAMAHAADEHDSYTDADSLRIIPTLANNARLGLTDLTGAVLWQLLANPALTGEIAADNRQLDGTVEEILRLEPPVQSVQRQTAAPVELGGEAVPVGAPVLVQLAAANRDETVFPDPDRLDPRRSNAANHLSFGYGADYCIGAPLVRRATVILTTSFLIRRAEIRLDDDAPVRHWVNPFNRGLQRLDVLVEG